MAGLADTAASRASSAVRLPQARRGTREATARGNRRLLPAARAPRTGQPRTVRVACLRQPRVRRNALILATTDCVGPAAGPGWPRQLDRGAFKDVPIKDFLPILLLYAAYTLGIGLVFVLRAFNRKRELFLPGWKAAERLLKRQPIGTDHDGRNVYRSEEVLFDALGRKRPLEQPLDSLVGLLVVLAIYAVGVEVALSTNDVFDDPGGALLTFVPFGVAAFALNLWGLRRLHFRRWRQPNSAAYPMGAVRLVGCCRPTASSVLGPSGVAELVLGGLTARRCESAERIGACYRIEADAAARPRLTKVPAMDRGAAAQPHRAAYLNRGGCQGWG
jgi:hypothetical protein